MEIMTQIVVRNWNHAGFRLRSGLQAGRPLGASVADMIHTTGLDRLAALYSNLTGLDCGCRARQETLDRLVPNVGINPLLTGNELT